MQLSRLIGPELEQILRENPSEVRELLDEIHPADFADIVRELDDQRAGALLVELPPDFAAQVFEHLEEPQQETLAEEMGLEHTARLTSHMDADDRADFFSVLPPAIGAPLLETLEKVDPEAAEEVEELSRWPDTSAGGLMTTELVSVRPGLTIGQAIAEVRRRAHEVDAVDRVFVVADGGHLEGTLELLELLRAGETVPVSDVMQRNVISVPPELDQEEVADVLAKYDLVTLPVVDQRGTLLGVITSDDILDVVREEHEEDVQRMGAVQPIDEGYFAASLGVYVRKRAPWLLVLFVGGFFTTTAMRRFDGALAAVASLSFYLPLLISAGGNSGSQSSTLVIRALATGDIEARDWHRVLLRELAQGLILGSMLAALGATRVLASGDGLELALVVAATLVCIVVMGCVVGGMMPLALSRLGLDPATSSTPFIATLVDVLGIVIYLGLATLLLEAVARAHPVVGVP
ncbi:MAG: magnesium transporter [Polyangiaceae bacterium]|nr:magnesium transporter [Polyangiaceae bacterium]